MDASAGISVSKGSPVHQNSSKKRQAELTEPENLQPDACINVDPCYPSKRRKENSMEAQKSPSLLSQASNAYNDGKFQVAALRFRLLLCLYGEQNSQSTSEYPNTAMVQVCLDLTRCYLNLKLPETAHVVLEDAWRPNRTVTVEITHPLFKDLSRLYLENKDLDALQEEPERATVEDLVLIYNYGTQYLFEGQPQHAAALLRNAVRRTEGDGRTDIGESLKSVLVKIHLLLAEAYLCLGRLEDVQTTLKTVWSPIHYLYIDLHHQHFLWMARIHARTTKPQTGANYNYDCFTAKKLDFYERLGLPPTADNVEIKKAYKRCSLIFHPDKGGDTVAFQQVREAYEALSLPEARRKYNYNHKYSR